MATLTIQPDAAAGKDAWMASNSATTNRGTSATPYIGDFSTTDSMAARDLYAFDVSGVPAGAVVTSAVLSLWEEFAGRTAGAPASWAAELRRVLMNWVEAEETWNIYSTGNNWATAGCSNATDCVAAASASLTMDGTAASNFVSWSGAGLVADVQAWVDGTASNYGWLLSAPTAEMMGTTDVAWNQFLSSDYATAARRPKLALEYYTGAFALRTDHYARMRRG